MGRLPYIRNLQRCSGKTLSSLHSFIRHTHLKDAVGSGADRKYVLTGRGNVPVRKQVELLTRPATRAFIVSSGRRCGILIWRNPRSRLRITPG